jgi:hypothetical protein
MNLNNRREMISGRFTTLGGEWMRLRFITLSLLFVCADFGFTQVTYPPVALAFPQVAFGGDSGGQNYVTIIQAVNNNSVSITGRIELFSDSGSPLAALFDGQGPHWALEIALAGGETRQIQLTLNGVLTSGWMQITYSPSEALTSVILQFRSGTTLLSEVGVDPAFETIDATDFAAETLATLNTGIAIANPSLAPAYVLVTVWDPGSGNPISNGRTVITLPPNGHVAKFLTELFPNVLNISQIRTKISLDSCSSASCSFAGGDGFLATAIRLNGDQFTTIPVTGRLSDGDSHRVLPQVAFGGPANGLNMKTVLYFTTNVSSGVFGTADIFDDGGNPLRASADGEPASSTIRFTVPGNRVSRVVLSGDQTLRSGWIRLTLSGSVHLIVSAVFQTFIGETLVSEASVLEAPPVERGLIYVKTQSGAANVGVAFTNSQAGSNTITLDLFNREGFLAGTRSITLAENGHVAQFVTEIFPELASLADFDGALSIHSSIPFSALALRLIGDKIATLPVADDGMYRPFITGLRITSTQRSPAQVNFEVDLTDFDADIATTSSTTVSANVLVDFGANVFDFGEITMDGTNIVNRPTGTLRGAFQSRFTGVPSGLSAVLYFVVDDSAGNASNFVGVPFRF